jgi:hypothetical protein
MTGSNQAAQQRQEASARGSTQCTWQSLVSAVLCCTWQCLVIAVLCCAVTQQVLCYAVSAVLQPVLRLQHAASFPEGVQDGA